MIRIRLLFLLFFLASSYIFSDNRVLNLDGDGDYVQIPTSVWFNGDLTVEAWVCVKEYRSWSRLIDFGNGADQDNVLLSLSREETGIPVLHIVKSGGLESPTALELNTWTHIAFTLKGNTSSFLINGQVVSQGRFSAPPRDIERQKNFIGRSNWRNEDAEAMLDEIRIWNLARSAIEIQQAMDSPLSGSEKGLIGYWNFDDGTADDLSTNSRDGELKGGAEIVTSPLSLVMDNETIDPGQTFEFDISIQHATKGDSLTFDLGYDPLVLKVEKVKKSSAISSWQEPKIDHQKGIISLVDLYHGRIDSPFQTKLVTVAFQSLKTSQTQLRIERPQLIDADGKHKSIDVAEATIRSFPQANLMQAFRKLELRKIFATRGKKRKTQTDKATTKKEQLRQNRQTDHNLTVDDIFPADRVLDIQIIIDQDNWDTIRHQTRDAKTALSEQRKYSPTDRPYTYTQASFSIDGIVFPQIGIRKKGFLGSSRNSDRPSLKIKLNHIDETGQIDGLTNLTFNNNQQDVSLVSQFLAYKLFNAAGIPAPRCAYAKVTVNGQNLGIYTHVERIHRPLLKRGFGNSSGALYEGTLVDFLPNWSGSFEHKFGSDKKGRKLIQQLIDVLGQPGENMESEIGRIVDLDSFYTFWAMEGLLGCWDGYSGNRNNFFIYLNPDTEKFHFIPWGADSLFEKYSRIKKGETGPISVKKQGIITHHLYQSESGRNSYEQALREILDQYWDEKDLLKETERIETLIKPYLTQETVDDLIKEETRGLINWMKGLSDQERKEALNSEKIKHLSSEFGVDLLVIKEMITKSLAEKELENGEIGKSDKNDKKSKDRGRKIQSAYRFVQSLENRRQFIKDRKGEVITEITDGMPEWKEDLVDPSWWIQPLDKRSFWTSIANGNIKSVKIHLNQIDINDQSTVFFGLTPLSIAAATGKSKMVKFLLKQGVDINSRNKDGGTALHGAVFLGRSKSVQLLLEHGIDIKAQSHNGIKASDLLSTHTDTIDIINQSFRLGLNRDEIEKGRSEVSQLLGF